MDYIWHTELLNFLAAGDYPEGLSRDEKRNYRRKAKSFETKGDKTLFYIQGKARLQVILEGQTEAIMKELHGGTVVKIISSFIFAYETYLVHVYSHACLCKSVHISTGCVLGGVGHSILGAILFRDWFIEIEWPGVILFRDTGRIFGRKRIF